MQVRKLVKTGLCLRQAAVQGFFVDKSNTVRETDSLTW